MTDTTPAIKKKQEKTKQLDQTSQAEPEKKSKVVFKREIQVRFKPEDIPKEVREKIIRWYTIGDVPVSQIIRRINPEVSRLRRRLLSYVDIYSILYLEYKKGKEGKSRHKVSNTRSKDYGELTLEQFAKFYYEWKMGGSRDDCMRAIGSSDRSRNYCRKIFTSLMERWRQCRQARGQKPLGQQAQTIKSLLDYAKRANIHGRPSIVIYLDNIPEDLYEEAMRTIPNFITVVDSPSYDPAVVKERLQNLEKAEIQNGLHHRLDDNRGSNFEFEDNE